MKKSKRILLSLTGSIAIAACGAQGEKGEKGDSCTVVTNDNGSATIKCTDGSSYLITSTNMPTAEVYDYCLSGYFDPNCLPCTCKNGTCNDSTQGDGKCSSCNK